MLAFDRAEPSDTRRNDDTHPGCSLRSHNQGSVSASKLRSRDRILDEDVHLLDVFLGNELQRVEALNLPRNS